MMRYGITLLSVALFSIAGQLPAQTNSTSPNFQEVYDLIRQHAAGVTDAELNRAAIEGMVSALAPKVALVTNAANNGAAAASPVTQTTIFEGEIAYLRVAQVDEGLAKAVSAAVQKLKSTNKVSGVALDLRYADGTDYGAAVATIDLFLSKNRPLLNWGQGVVSSHDKTDAIGVPVAVLVNHETTGASEALAAMVREADAGLIIGSSTAGEAMVTKDFPLTNGMELRIASAPVTLGDGSAISNQGIKPDIHVAVGAEAEKAFYADAFLVVPQSARVAGASAPDSNSMSEAVEPVRFNEAELVREHNAGENPEEQLAKRPPEPHVPVVSDPALARALDLLKGLAVVRENKF